MTRSDSFIPNSFQTPNLLIDRVMPLLTDTEFRVLMYTVRHILGWQDTVHHQTRLSLSAYQEGHRGQPGCGLGRQAIIHALDSLVRFGLLLKVGEPTQDGQLWELVVDERQVKWDLLVQRQQARATARQQQTRQATQTRLQKQAERAAHEPDDAAGTSDVPPVRATNQPRGTLDVPPAGTSHEPAAGTSDDPIETPDLETHLETQPDSGAGAPVDAPRDEIFEGVVTRGFGLALDDKAGVEAARPKINWIVSWLKGNAVRRDGRDKGKGLPGCAPPMTPQELSAFYDDYEQKRDRDGAPLGKPTTAPSMAVCVGQYRVRQTTNQQGGKHDNRTIQPVRPAVVGRAGSRAASETRLIPKPYIPSLRGAD